MAKDNKKIELVRSEYGYYHYSPPPSQSELQQYYADKYFQEGHGSYTVSYTDDEISYFQLKAKLIYRKASRLMSLSQKTSFIDVGCGEGWVLSEFHKHGHPILGFDFSRHGIDKFAPHLAPHFKQGDVYGNLEKEILSNNKYDILLLANVVEHVLDPEELLRKLKRIMAKDALLVIIAPNDFSMLHEHLIKNKFISKEFWLSYPDHLSYFNKESMTNFLTAIGYDIVSVVADNPIDLNLLNQNSNYINDPTKGKETHYYRVRADNFLAGVDIDKLLNIYDILGSMGVGRDLNYYCRISP